MAFAWNLCVSSYATHPKVILTGKRHSRGTKRAIGEFVGVVPNHHHVHRTVPKQSINATAPSYDAMHLEAPHSPARRRARWARCLLKDASSDSSLSKMVRGCLTPGYFSPGHFILRFLLFSTKDISIPEMNCTARLYYWRLRECRPLNQLMQASRAGQNEHSASASQRQLI